MNTLKQLVLQEADTQKILLNIQTFMECALEVRAEAWQSIELPWIPALLHIFPGVSKSPCTWLFFCSIGDGIVLTKLYVSCAKEQVPVSGWGEGNYCFCHRNLCDDKMLHDNVFLGHLHVILILSEHRLWPLLSHLRDNQEYNHPRIYGRSQITPVFVSWAAAVA